jgi:hypothetical protein
MAIDPRYILAPDLQSLFRDKTTGLPLADGVIYFWIDNSRSDPKPIFQLTGTPPDYSFTELPNPLTLTGIGTMSDGANNDIIPYWFPEDSDGNLQLYYVQVYSAGGMETGVLQFTREAWPAGLETGPPPSEVELVNFVPNGQFLVHNNVLAMTGTPGTPAGLITQPLTQLAPYWTFERPTGTSSIDYVTFTRLPPVIVPTASPRYAFSLNTTFPNSGDSQKDLCIRFGDVNKFASDVDYYTYSFSGQVNTGTTGTVQLYLEKNFGTDGGDATTYTLLDTFSLTSNYESYQSSFIFGVNTTNNLGPNDDDYVALVLRFPNAIQNTSVTDIMLNPGAVTVTEFVPTPDFIFTGNELAPAVPDYNSLDFGLPLIYTPTGVTYDTGTVGSVETHFRTSNFYGRLLCDGTGYETAAISPDGIPYSRLWNELIWQPSINMPMFGTGATYVTAVPLHTSASGENAVFRLVTNARGAVTNPADGTVPTGFGFFTNFTGSTAFGFTCYMTSPTTVRVIYTAGLGEVVFPLEWFAGTTLFGLNLVISDTNTNIEGIISTTSSVPPSSHYFLLADTNPIDGIYVWFNINGTGSDPGPIFFFERFYNRGIQIACSSQYDGTDAAHLVREVLSGYQSNEITCLAASAIPTGAYFTFHCNGSSPNNAFYIWYTVNGVGTDPAPAGFRGIPVALLSTDTAAIVCTKTQIAINSKFYAVPATQGVFLRGNDPNGIIDQDSATRMGLTDETYGPNVATLQTSRNRSHHHTQTFATGYVSQGLFSYLSGNGESNVGVPIATTNAILDSGIFESRPYSMSVNWFIRY